MEDRSQSNKQDDDRPRQPTYRQMGRYAIEGLILTLAATPLLYMKWMKRSPLPWLSAESFNGFGVFLIIAGVIFVLVRIGSHGDTDGEA